MVVSLFCAGGLTSLWFFSTHTHTHKTCGRLEGNSKTVFLGAPVRTELDWKHPLRGGVVIGSGAGENLNRSRRCCKTGVEALQKVSKPRAFA